MALSIESFCIRNIYTRNIGAINLSLTVGVYIKSAFVKAIYSKNIYAKSAYTIKYSKMHLQFFQILEIKLFETRLETKIGVG